VHIVLLRMAISVWQICGVPTVNLFLADLKGEYNNINSRLDATVIILLTI